MAAYAQALLFAIPGFTLLMLIEMTYGVIVGKNTFRVMDSVSSISSGLTNIIKDSLGLALALVSYPFLLKYLSVMELQATVWVFLIGFIAKDFASYWNHRFNHEINILWNRHVIHHSSEEFNLPCALRQSISVIFNFYALFLIPAAIVGVPFKVIAIISPIHLFLQFWYHTKHIGKMGWLEYIIVTPSQHRVHHAINPEYIDKNYSAIFCIWDRMFGTFQEELDDIPPVYGVLTPPRTWNPIKINFQHVWKLTKDAFYTKRWSDRLSLWFRPTGWRPEDVKETHPWNGIDDVYAYEKYDTPASTAFKFWSVMQMGAAVVLIMWMFYHIVQVGKITPSVLLYGFLLVASVYGYTSLMDGDRSAPVVETFRSLLGLGIVFYTSDWFGLKATLSVGPYLVIGYFVLTILGAWYFSLVEQRNWQGRKPAPPASTPDEQPA